MLQDDPGVLRMHGDNGQVRLHLLRPHEQYPVLLRHDDDDLGQVPQVNPRPLSDPGLSEPPAAVRPGVCYFLPPLAMNCTTAAGMAGLPPLLRGLAACVV